MKAVVCTRYGPPDVLRIADVDVPLPKAGEVRVRVHATAVTASDCIVRACARPVWHPLGLMMRLALGFSGPRNPILGMVFAGDVESIGEGVTYFQPGDAVCGFTGTRMSCYAEYLCVPEQDHARLPVTVPTVIASKPASATYEQAAALVYGAGLASYFLERADIQPGQRVLIYGASGAIGTTAVQLAKHRYGAHVTGVCSTANLDLVRSLGADDVLDYTRQDALAPDARYDFVFDAVGKAKTSALKQACQQALAPNGTFSSVDSGNPTLRPAHLEQIGALVDAGRFTPVIDRCYPMAQIVEAHRYVDQGHKKGNVVITVRANGTTGGQS